MCILAFECIGMSIYVCNYALFIVLVILMSYCCVDVSFSSLCLSMFLRSMGPVEKRREISQLDVEKL